METDPIHFRFAEVTPEGMGREELLTTLYVELRRLATHLLRQERPGVTLQPTSLVHEAFLRMAHGEDGTWESRRHFFNAAALVMRRVLVDRARRRPECVKVDASDEVLRAIEIPAAVEYRPEEFEPLDAALDELRQHNERWAEIVHLRFFLGLTVEQTAEMLGVSPRTVKSDWAFARAWLRWAVRRRGSEKRGTENDER